MQYESAAIDRVGQSDFDSDAVPFSGASASPVGGGGGTKPITIRKEFPETWLFEDFDMENR